MPVILDLCSGSGSWSQPYADAGYDVVRLDAKDGQDVRLMEKPTRHYHGILAAPPCTHFASSGARWWKEKGEGALLEGLSIVDACIRIIHLAQPAWWALENPVGRLVQYLGQPALKFDPCDYGDPLHQANVPVGKVQGASPHTSTSNGGQQDAPDVVLVERSAVSDPAGVRAGVL